MAVGWWMDILGNNEEIIMKIISNIKDIIFPTHCLGCNQEGSWICKKCLANIQLNYQIDQAIESLDGLIAFFNYNEKEIIGRLIKLLKYDYITELNNYIEEILLKNNIIIEEDLSQMIIIPVPLHLRRLRERGFNQSDILANIFKNKFNLGDIDNKLLLRKKYTPQQAKLNKEDRIKNLQGAFVVNNNKLIPKSVVLVDDIYTTGVTMLECALALRKKGVKNIWGMVLARG